MTGQLNRARMFDSGPFITEQVIPGVFPIQEKDEVRDLDNDFEPSDLFTPRDWSASDPAKMPDVPPTEA